MKKRLHRFFTTVLLCSFAATLVGVGPRITLAQLETGHLYGRVKDLQGEIIVTFPLPKGNVKVHLPDDIAAGDTISGTVVSEPAGKTEAERSGNRGELNGYVIELPGQKTTPASPPFKWTLPAGAGGPAPLILRDRSGAEIARVDIPVAAPPPIVDRTQPVFIFPPISVIYRPLVIFGPFDGDASNTRVTLGGVPATVLAESPRQTVVANPASATGPLAIEVREGPSTAGAGTTRNLRMDLTAPKTTLRRGESTELHVQVTGLQGVTAPVPLHILNRSDLILSLGGGNEQLLFIQPSEVRRGQFALTRTLTGITAGDFMIVADVPAGNSVIALNPAACRRLFEATAAIDGQARELRKQGLAKQADDKQAQADALRDKANCTLAP